MGQAIVPTDMPLLNWPEQSKIDALKNRRTDLQQSINKLPPNSHRRIVLNARLCILTENQLVLELKTTTGVL